MASNEVSQEAYSEIVDALTKDMPLIMHGSGDVPVHGINPKSARLLAQLTVRRLYSYLAAIVLECLVLLLFIDACAVDAVINANLYGTMPVPMPMPMQLFKSMLMPSILSCRLPI